MTASDNVNPPMRAPRRALVYLLAFTGGFVIMSFELLGGRIQAPWFGSGIYVWGSIISVFMLSLAIGYLLGGRLSLRRASLRWFAFMFSRRRSPRSIRWSASRTR